MLKNSGYHIIHELLVEKGFYPPLLFAENSGMHLFLWIIYIEVNTRFLNKHACNRIYDRNMQGAKTLERQ